MSAKISLANSDCVVTGGAGAIGSRLTRLLLAQGAGRVVVIDDLSSGHAWLLPQDPRLEFHQVDVNRLVEHPLATPGAMIFHLAAFFANQNSVDHPLDDLHTNARGTLATLLWADQQHAARLVYASAGCSIAGHGIDGPISENMPVSLHLDTPYQITKALGEFYCNYFLPRLPTVRCRFFNSYGPGEVPGPYRNVIPNFIWRALHHQPLIITGTGEETRDFIYVDDLVQALLTAAERSEAVGMAFNLGTGVQTRIGDLAEWVIAACGSRSRIEFAPRRSWDHSTHRQADITRARLRLGLESRVGVREGLERSVAWFREHATAIAAAAGVAR